MKEFNKEEFLKNYNPFLKTALKRTNLSQPMKILLNKRLLDNKTNLDFGTGWGVDFKIIKKQYSRSNNLSIAAYDLFNKEFYLPQVLKDKHYDNITCFYVFNIMPLLEEQERLVELFKSLADNIYIAVRSDVKSVKDTWVYIDEWEGYITPKKSFQRFYDENIIKRYFGQVDYISNNSKFKLFKLKNE